MWDREKLLVGVRSQWLLAHVRLEPPSAICDAINIILVGFGLWMCFDLFEESVIKFWLEEMRLGQKWEKAKGKRVGGTAKSVEIVSAYFLGLQIDVCLLSPLLYQSIFTYPLKGSKISFGSRCQISLPLAQSLVGPKGGRVSSKRECVLDKATHPREAGSKEITPKKALSQRTRTLNKWINLVTGSELSWSAHLP